MKKIMSLLLLVTFLNFNCAAFVKADTISQKTSNFRTEHLKQSEKVQKKTPTDIVITHPSFSKVLEFNVIELSFAQNFSTKNAKVGDEVGFLLDKDLTTTAGTVVVPAGSIVTARVKKLTKPKSFNRSGKIYLIFDGITFPDGTRTSFNAQVFNKKNGMLSRGKLNALGKGLGTTLGTMGVATGIGCGIGVAAGAVVVGGLAIGMPIGFAVGAIIGFVTPGLHYKAKAGDKLMVQLTDDLEIQR